MGEEIRKKYIKQKARHFHDLVTVDHLRGTNLNGSTFERFLDIFSNLLCCHPFGIRTTNITSNNPMEGKACPSHNIHSFSFVIQMGGRKFRKKISTRINEGNIRNFTFHTLGRRLGQELMDGCGNPLEQREDLKIIKVIFSCIFRIRPFKFCP